MKKLIEEAFFGKKRWQKLFEKMHNISVKGMNYSRGDDLLTSGEVPALLYAKSMFPGDQTLTLFDVGGNTGKYSNMLIELFQDRKYTIHVFEPSKTTYQALVSNVSKTENIIFNNCGLSNEEYTGNLYADQDCSGKASLYKRNLDFLGIAMDRVEEIKLTTIDKYCSEKKIDTIHYLKLDIEGNELQALQGASEMIKNKKIAFIQFEFGGANIDSRTFFKDFWTMFHTDYTFYRILNNGLVKIDKYRETLEIFTTINYLLELKK